MAHDFRKPVFVRSDDTTHIEASLVVWDNDAGAAASVKVTNGNGESVLISVNDWAALVNCINVEINRAL